jgi:hypothetical protein
MVDQSNDVPPFKHETEAAAYRLVGAPLLDAAGSA